MQGDREFKASLCYAVGLMAVLYETCLRTFESYSPTYWILLVSSSILFSEFKSRLKT